MQFTCIFVPPLAEDKVQRVITEFSKVGIDATELSRDGLVVTFTAPGTETGVAGPLLDSWGKPRHGALKVTLYEGADLSVADRYSDVFRRLELEPCWEHEQYGGGPSPFNHQFLPYALLDFDHSQVIVGSIGGTTKNPLWGGSKTPYIFNLSRGNRDFFLGVVRLNPWIGESHQSVQAAKLDEKSSIAVRLEREDETSETNWLDIQDGTGKIHINIQFVEYELPTRIHSVSTDHVDFMDPIIGNATIGLVSKVKTKLTDRIYAFRQLQKDQNCTPEVRATIISEMNNAFIVPIRKERRFDISGSKFYAAELLCVFECLHKFNIDGCHIRPKNVLLDALGHIALCDFSLYMLGTIRETWTLEYPAPELLLGQDVTEVVDWGTLGVFLYEMLTGLPPFYDEDTIKKNRKILSGPLNFPEPNIAPSIARDLLIELLNREPKHRIGYNGIVEIKRHPFFHGIDWQKLLHRKYEPAFKPGNITERFHEEPGLPGSTWKKTRRVVELARRIKQKKEDTSSQMSEKKGLISPSLPSQVAVEIDDGWTLIWEKPTWTFYFYNNFTGAKQSANPQGPHPLTSGVKGGPVHAILTQDTALLDDCLTDENLPTQTQMQDALEAALNAGYKRAIPQLLEYDMDLNIKLFGGSRTPLEWVTERENIVEKGNHELVKVLVPRTERLLCTKALCLAIDREDGTIVDLLLEHGVGCDFIDGDRPPPIDYEMERWNIMEGGKGKEFFPPLVRAVITGSKDLVQKLLENGADVNVGYHDLPCSHGRNMKKTFMSCERVIQVAMELQRLEIVDCLLEFGADINLPQPVRLYHECRGIPRNIYLKNTSDLRTAAATLKQRKEIKEGR
ncbi:protein kinase [Xylogone sp. PMI_703]|nr:protein kinase [Xylogone sp. PMI_703]